MQDVRRGRVIQRSSPLYTAQITVSRRIAVLAEDVTHPVGNLAERCLRLDRDEDRVDQVGFGARRIADGIEGALDGIAVSTVS